MDFIERLPHSRKNVIFMLVDKFIKYGYFIAITHPFTTQEIMKVLLNQLYKFHGLPNNYCHR